MVSVHSDEHYTHTYKRFIESIHKHRVANSTKLTMDHYRTFIDISNKNKPFARLCSLQETLINCLCSAERSSNVHTKLRSILNEQYIEQKQQLHSAVELLQPFCIQHDRQNNSTHREHSLDLCFMTSKDLKITHADKGERLGEWKETETNIKRNG